MVYRGIDHKKIKDVLENVAKPNIKLAIRKALKREDVSAELRKFAGVFVTIQQFRHVADYDPTTIWSKTDVNDLIDEVDDALQSFRKLDPAELTDIVVYALLGARAS